MALKEWNLTENFNLQELNDNFSFLDEKNETTNTVVNTKASQTSVADLAQDVTDLITVVENHATYSTTEEIIIGTYDGKPLYRKAVLISALASSAGSTNYAHAIANVAKIIIGSNSHATNGTNWIPIPFVYSVAADNIGAFATSTNVNISVGQNRSTYSATIFVEYTKTTD